MSFDDATCNSDMFVGPRTKGTNTLAVSHFVSDSVVGVFRTDCTRIAQVAGHYWSGLQRRDSVSVVDRKERHTVEGQKKKHTSRMMTSRQEYRTATKKS